MIRRRKTQWLVSTRTVSVENVFWQKPLGTPDAVTPEKKLLDLCRTQDETSAGRMMRTAAWVLKILQRVRHAGKYLLIRFFTETCGRTKFWVLWRDKHVFSRVTRNLTPRWFLQGLAADLNKRKRKLTFCSLTRSDWKKFVRKFYNFIKSVFIFQPPKNKKNLKIKKYL